MSLRYKGAVVSATPPTVSATSPTPYGTATGVWTLQQQLQYQGAGTWPSPFTPTYIEDLFNTYLYTGNGSTQTITNGIDLSTKGGLVWIKNRGAAQSHGLSDTARGAGNWMSSDLTVANIANNNGGVSAFTSTGFSVNTSDAQVNGSSNTYASWTFREQPKFFDVVTFTTPSSSNSNFRVNHNLGSTPGMIVVKSTAIADSWWVWHTDLTNVTNSYLILNNSNAASTSANMWGTSGPTSTDFGVNTGFFGSNNSYVAYLFANNAGGFGANGTDNVISCGGFQTDVAGEASVTLGWEPQWLLVKTKSSVGNWQIFDTMRGWVSNGAAAVDDQQLRPNLTNAENTVQGGFPTSTGFYYSGGGSSVTYVYVAIRRGPMKTPTSSTTVFSPQINSTASPRTWTPGFPVDLSILSYRTTFAAVGFTGTRLTGNSQYLTTTSTAAEDNGGPTAYQFDSSTGNLTESLLTSSASKVNWMFGRAPGFFDVVCYTGTGSGPRWIDHNLTTAPQFIIVKNRSNANSWTCSMPAIGQDKVVYINLNTAASTDATMFPSAPTSTQFRVANGGGNTNSNGYTYVAYLFASVSGVSKVGSYTGTGTTKQVDCGFTNGSRFVLIKRTDDTGDWYVWDSARGIVAGNDPYLLLNSSAVEVTNTDYVDTYSAGFELSSTAPAALNANGGTYIFLAIA